MKKFKWKLIEKDGKDCVCVEHNNVTTTSPVFTFFNGNEDSKIFIPPNPYKNLEELPEDHKELYEDGYDITRSDVSFKAVKDGYADIAYPVLANEYQDSNICCHYVPIKFLDQKIGKEMNEKFNSIFGDMKFVWFIRFFGKNNTVWDACNNKANLTEFPTKEDAEIYVNNIKDVAKLFATKSSVVLSFNLDFEGYVKIRNEYKGALRRFGGIDLFEAYLDFFKNKTKEEPKVRYETNPIVGASGYIEKIGYIVEKE